MTGVLTEGTFGHTGAQGECHVRTDAEIRKVSASPGERRMPVNPGGRGRGRERFPPMAPGGEPCRHLVLGPPEL